MKCDFQGTNSLDSSNGNVNGKGTKRHALRFEATAEAKSRTKYHADKTGHYPVSSANSV